MARYGVSTYGDSFYGIPSATSFTAEPVVCTATDYGAILLTWRSPGGIWDELVVVRNLSGYPVSPTNGLTVASVASGSDLGEFREDGLPLGAWVYYGIFVHDVIGDTWVRAGVAECYSPNDYASGDRLGALLPAQLQSDALLAFMQIIGYSLDLLRNDGYTLLDLYDTKVLKYDLVPVLMRQFGIPPECELEPEQYRRFLRHAVLFYKTKGTSECVHGVTSAITGWDSTIDIGANLLWDADFSDFVGSTAFWSRGAVNCTVSWVAGTVDTFDEVVPAAMRLTAVANGNLETTFANPASNVADLHHLGIPVAVGVDYVVDALIQASDFAQSAAHLALRWYDLSGTLLGTSIGSSVATRQFVDTPVEATGVAPVNAVWMLPVVLVASAHAGSHWDVRTIQVARGAETVPHEHGRDIRIGLAANRVNEVSNGSFETGTAGWVAQGDASIAQNGGQAVVGSHSLAVTYTGAGVTDTGAVPEDGVRYSFTTLPGRRYGVQVEVAHDGNGAALNYMVAATDTAQSHFLLDADGTYATARLDTDGSANTLNSDHDEPAFAFVAEDTQTSLVVGFIDAHTGAALHVDAVIVEVSDQGTSLDWQVRNSDFVQPYFDGASLSETLDYFWEGAPYNSRSHFYDRRIIHEQRLCAILPRYLPFGATFTLLFAQPVVLSSGGSGFAANDDVILAGFSFVPTTHVGRAVSLEWDNEFDASALVALRWSQRAAVGKSVALRWNQPDPS